MLAPPATATLLRPSMSRLTTYLIGIVPLGAALLVLAAARAVISPHRLAGPLWFAVVVLAIFVPLVVAGVLYVANVWVQVRRREVVWTDLLSRRRSAPLEELGLAVVQPLTHAGHPSRRLIVIDRSGRRVLSVDGRLWDDADLDDLIGRLGLAARVTRVRNARQLRKLFPHAAPWWQAHPWRLGAPMVLVGLALAFAAVRLLALPV